MKRSVFRALCTEFWRRAQTSCGGSSRQLEDRDVCPYCNSFLFEDYIWCVSTGRRRQQQEETLQLVVRDLWWSDEWRAPNRILVVQIGTDASQAKVFKAHAVPQGLCDNLINALKLLANQQRDCDSPIQSIVKGIHGRSRKGIIDCLICFNEVDNHSAVT